ncbi:LEPR-XLL domain-containing protein [Methylorubrum zatmanii]|uniref:LEPR-XLL domain-containing protein n=1 Tax=Methylorubrum zatmanii TaxID=29429 RepID=UPI0031B59CED
MLRLKAKADRLFNRDRLIFDPLEPRVLLNSDITYQIGATSDAATAEHQILVKLIERQETVDNATKTVQRIQVFDYANGQQSADPLHTFGAIDANSNQAYTLTGSGGKETITVDADSFKLLTGNQKPVLAFEDGNGNRANTISLLNTPAGATGAEFDLTKADGGTIASGKFSGRFSDVANLIGASGASDTLTIGQDGSLSGTFGGGQGGLQLDLSAMMAGSVDATLSAANGKYALSRSGGTSAATFDSPAFTAPTKSLGVLLGSGDDTLHLASLPSASSFTVSGGAGADRIVFDSDLGGLSGNRALTFDGGEGDDRIELSANLSVAGDLGITFKGGAGTNSLVVGNGKTIQAGGSLTLAADATVTPIATSSGIDRSASATARMSVTVNENAVIRGAGVAIKVSSDITVSDTVPADTSTLSVTATGLAGITLDGTVDAGTGDAALTSDVSNRVTLVSTLSSQLKGITPSQTNSATIAVGAKGAVNGGTVKIAAGTVAKVDVKVLGLTLPGLATVTGAAAETFGKLKSAVTGEGSFADVFTPTELAAKGLIKSAETTISNTTQVTVASGARIVQTGAANAIAGSDPAIAVQISADDRTDAKTTLVTTDGAAVPSLHFDDPALDAAADAAAKAAAAIDVLNMFGLTGTQTVTRLTSVDLGVPAAGTLPASAPAAGDPALLSAEGKAAIRAANSGTVAVRIRAATEAPDPADPEKNTVAGNGEDDGSLPAPIKAGAAQITVNDTVRVAVRGVSVAAASLAVSATNDSVIEARAIQARNLLTGSTVALVEKARLSATGGAVSVVAMDATAASAIAEPIQTDSLEPESAADKARRELIGITRSSAVNTAERDITASLIASEASGSDGVTLTAQNALDLTTEAKAAVAASKFGIAGSYAVNIVLGSTTATVQGGSVTAASGDVTVNAADVTNIDSRVQTSVEGKDVSGGTAIGGAAAFNIVGYRADGVANTGKLADKIVGMALDAVLGSGFFTVAATQAIRARVDAATVTASAGRVGLNAVSGGTVDATVSNTVTVRTPDQTRLDAAKAQATRTALNKARTFLGKPTLGGEPGAVTSASSRSIGGLIATNRMNRSATADVISGATITSGGELGLRAVDLSTINANVKLVASSQAASDGGLPSKQPQIRSDYKLSAAQPVAITLGQRVAVDFSTLLGEQAIKTVGTLDAIKANLPSTTKQAQTGTTPPKAPTLKPISKGDVVLVSPGHPAGKGAINSYYRYVKDTTAGPDSLDLSKEDFTGANWELIGAKGAVYAYMGADRTDANKLDLKTAKFSDRDLWRRVGESEAAPTKATGSGGLSAGGIVVRNEIKGGVTAAISSTANATTTVKAGSVAVSAERGATITSAADATVEAIATIKEQTGAKEDGSAGTGTASTVPGQTSAFDKATQSRSSALAINAVIATNTIQSAADASISDSDITTTGSDGAVAVGAKTTGSIEAGVNAQITALSSGPAGTDDTAPAASTSAASTPATGTGQAVPPTTTARAGGLQLAFNAIGYESGNLGFDTLDALVGTNLVSPATAQASARITNTKVTATGAVSATAESSGSIASTLGNEVTASARAASVNALAVSGLVAMNRVSGAAQASIDAANKSVSGTDVTVSAVDSVGIAAETAVAASATVEKTGSVSGVGKSAEALLGEYTYTTASGSRQVKFGQKIRLSDSWAGKGEKGAVYQYMGTDFDAALDLGSTTDPKLDFSDFALWKKLDASNVVAGATSAKPPAAKLSATGLGGVFSRNDVSGKAEAWIANTTLAASGDVGVTASSEATITAKDESEIEVEGGSAFSGVLVSNNVQNGARAFVKNSTVTSDEGGVTVSSENSSKIEAEATGSVTGETTAIGFTLAFNTVGFQQQNPLYNAVDTIVGDPLIATATKSENPAGATAFLTGSTVTAKRDVSVTADSQAQITASVGNKAEQADSAETVHKAETGAHGISAGAVLALNKVSARAEAFIGAETVADTAPAQTAATVSSTDGTVTVSAKNQAGIESTSTMIGASSVSGSVAELAKKAVATALTIYDYTSKSGSKTLKTGDRVRLAADFTPTAANASTDAQRPLGEDPVLKGRVFIFVGAASAQPVDLAAEDYTNAARWFALDDGATVTTKPSVAGTTGTTTDTTTGDTQNKDTTTVKTADGTVTITRNKARYSSKDGYQFMKAGEGVLLSKTDDQSKGEKGTIYIWRGADNTKVTLFGEDYTSDNWIPAAAKTVMPKLDTVADPAPAPRQM